jgi:hypothetical protein
LVTAQAQPGEARMYGVESEDEDDEDDWESIESA